MKKIFLLLVALLFGANALAMAMEVKCSAFSVVPPCSQNVKSFFVSDPDYTTSRSVLVVYQKENAGAADEFVRYEYYDLNNFSDAGIARSLYGLPDRKNDTEAFWVRWQEQLKKIPGIDKLLRVEKCPDKDGVVAWYEGRRKQKGGLYYNNDVKIMYVEGNGLYCITWHSSSLGKPEQLRKLSDKGIRLLLNSLHTKR